MSGGKIKDYLRQQPTERLPKLLTIYATDREASRLIQLEIKRRQAVVHPSSPTL